MWKGKKVQKLCSMHCNRLDSSHGQLRVSKFLDAVRRSTCGCIYGVYAEKHGSTKYYVKNVAVVFLSLFPSHEGIVAHRF